MAEARIVTGTGWGWGCLYVYVCLCLWSALPSTCYGYGESRDRNNVVLVMVDDLRSEALSRLRPEMLSRSALFSAVFAQQALCAPSRNSLLTGRRPDTLHLYDFYSYWRDFAGNYTTLPQYLKESGYRTYSFGKIFHPGKSSNFTDDYPYSWSVPPYHPSTDTYKDAKVCLDEETLLLAKNLVCPVVTEFQPGKTLPDIQTTDAAIEQLELHKATQNDTPFFMAVGYHKPHIPLKFPVHYLDLVPIENISMPAEPYRPVTLPTVAWNPWNDLRKRDDIKKLHLSFPFGNMPEKWVLKIKQSYYAAVYYVRDLISKLLTHINLNNTIIILTSDHGWSMGEHGEWSKFSNYDIALKVPLLIHMPASNIKKNTHTNRYSKKIIELLDLFPTIVDLLNLPPIPDCPKKSYNVQLCTQGKSFANLINDKRNGQNDPNTWKNTALSQYPRPSVFPTKKIDSDRPRLKNIKIMGYSIRTPSYRYTEWIGFNSTSIEPIWEKIYAQELYDHKIDPMENLNLADKPQLQPVIKKLHQKLRLLNN